MAGNDSAVLEVQAGKLGSALAYIHMGGAVGSVTAHAIFLIILVRKCVHIGGRCHSLVEGGIEDNCLRHIREHFLHCAYSQNVGRVVERGEVAADSDFLHHVLIYENGVLKEIRTLHDTVTDSVDFLEIADYPDLRVGKDTEHKLHTEGMVRYRLHPHYRLFSSWLMGKFAVREGYFFEITFCEKGIVFVAAHIKQLILDRRTSTIDDKNFHNGGKFSKKSRTFAHYLD